MDIVSSEKRSEMMSRIRGKNTKPERRVRTLLFELGYRYRIHYSSLPGCPDIVFQARRKALFIHGCFWHRHSCSQAYHPKSRVHFWQDKFAATQERDARNLIELENLGWKALVIWECELDDETQIRRRVTKFLGLPRFKP